MKNVLNMSPGDVFVIGSPIRKVYYEFNTATFKVRYDVVYTGEVCIFLERRLYGEFFVFSTGLGTTGFIAYDERDIVL